MATLLNCIYEYADFDIIKLDYTVWRNATGKCGNIGKQVLLKVTEC